MYKEKHLKRNKLLTLSIIITNWIYGLFPDIGEMFLNIGANFIEAIDLTIEEFNQNIRF